MAELVAQHPAVSAVGSAVEAATAALGMSGAGEGEAGTETLEQFVEVLNLVVEEARKVECPLWLGTQASNVAGVVKRREGGNGGVERVVRYWG